MTAKKMGAPLRFPEPTGDPARDRIIDLRRRLGLSQSGLGKRLGLTESAVRAWENGTRRPSGPVLKLLELLEKE
jgi:putative transcriptional regulator